MKGTGAVWSFLLAAVVLSGCATPREVDLAKLLQQLDQGTGTNATSYTGPDVPEAPATPFVPPGPDMGGETPGAGGQDATIQPDCVVRINVEEDPSLNGNYTVNPSGAIQLKYIGAVILFNRTEKQAEEKIRDVLRAHDFRKATVKVQILRLSYDRIQIDGEVNRPGVLQIGANDTVTLYEALLRSGGLRPPQGAMKVRIRRRGLLSLTPFAIEPEEYTLIGHDEKPNIPTVYLRPNDIVQVFSVGTGSPTEASGGARSILVLGEVKRPGFYNFSPEEPCTMMRLVFKMGGFPPYADQKAVQIMRRNADGSEQKIKVNAARLMESGDPTDDVPLQNGDRVRVRQRWIVLF